MMKYVASWELDLKGNNTFKNTSSLSHLQKHVDLPAPYSDDCILDHGTNLYDPKNAEAVPWWVDEAWETKHFFLAVWRTYCK